MLMNLHSKKRIRISINQKPYSNFPDFFFKYKFLILFFAKREKILVWDS